jgi:Family of unknown function (DUF6090)
MMLKFFRHIRQRLIREDRFSKYLLYAIGEIVLVVIGIIIALQINTWNENRKAVNEEVKILKALESDFKVSKTRIEETIKKQTDVLKYSHTLSEIYERQDTKEYQYFDTHLDSLSHLIGYGTSWYRAEPVTGAYNSLISAGKIDLIQNESLRNLLAQFMADVESGFEDQETSMHYLTKLNDGTDHFIFKILSNKFRTKFSYSPRKTDSLKVADAFFTDDGYFGTLSSKSVDEHNRLVYQNEMLGQVHAILEIIEQELSTKENGQ